MRERPSKYFQYTDSQIQFNWYFFPLSLALIQCVAFNHRVLVFLFECSKLIANDGWALQLNHISSSSHFLLLTLAVVVFLFQRSFSACALNSHYVYSPHIVYHSLVRSLFVAFCLCQYVCCVSTTMDFCFYVVPHFMYAICTHTHKRSANNLKCRIVPTTSCPMFEHSNIYTNHLHGADTHCEHVTSIH